VTVGGVPMNAGTSRPRYWMDPIPANPPQMRHRDSAFERNAKRGVPCTDKIFFLLAPHARKLIVPSFIRIEGSPYADQWAGLQQSALEHIGGSR